MDKPNSRPAYVAGNLSEYLGSTAGITKGTPVGVLTFRMHPASPQQINLMITRPQLERLREDIAFLLERSPSLNDGPSQEITLAELEATLDRLG